jgi:hypothetical protein
MLKKTLKYFFVFFGSITILSYFLNLPEKGVSATQDQLATFKEFIPEDRDSALMFIKVMLEDDKKATLSGDHENSLFHDSYPITSTREIRAAYDNNEISANQTYKDKVIRVKSTALLIGEAIGSSAYITVSSGNNDSFSGVNLYFDKKDPTLTTINKGSVIDAICVGKGKVLTFPMLDDCVFTVNRLNEIASITLNNIATAWMKDRSYVPLSQVEIHMVIITKALESEVKENCSDTGKKCLNKMSPMVDKIPEEKSKPIKPLISKVKDYIDSLPMFPSSEDRFKRMSHLKRLTSK